MIRILALDSGGCWTKLGIAGEENPDYTIRTTLGISDNGNTSNRETFIGVPEKMSDMTSLVSPIERGVIHEWDAMEQIWDYLFYTKMETDPETWQLTTVEPLLNPRYQIETKAQIFFEKYNFPSLCVTDEGTQTLLGHCISSALCMCIGDGTTTISAICDTFRVPSATQKLEIGGSDITMYLQSLICKRGYSFTSPGELETLREIKEKHCYALEVPIAEQDADWRVSAQNKSLISLPGGDVMPMGAEKWKCAELLFDPTLAGSHCPGLHHAIKKCLDHVPVNMRKTLVERIVCTGGTTHMSGLSERLVHEMKDTYPNCVPKVRVKPEEDLNYIGLSIVGSLYNCNDRFVSKAEYEEFGPSYVRNRHSLYTYTCTQDQLE
ncbi:uncharacterized protein [Argopecten irradians]|uniref:uncharacterized protein isoform X2 n=1 Tax=Argopecten irradians TaxID=31199 RepID=UPI00372135D9